MFGRRGVKVTHTNRQDKAPAATVRRSDVGCGISDCTSCLRKAHASYAPPLDGTQPIMIPEAAVIAAHFDVLDSPLVTNMVVLSTASQEAARGNRSVHVRLQKLITDPTKKCYVFPDDHHEATALAQRADESAAEFAQRSAFGAATWYGNHCRSEQLTCEVLHVVAATPSQKVQTLATAAGTTTTIRCVTLAQYLEERHGKECPLLDRLTELTTPAATGGRAVCKEHLSAAQVAAMLDSGKLFKGKFKASEGSCFFGDVRGKFGDDVGDRIILAGRGNVNRSVHGDTVAVEVLPVDEWRGPPGTRRTPDGLNAREALKQGFTPTGCVAGILKTDRREYCGSIDLSDGAAASQLSGAVSVLFQPKSGRIPRIRINTQQAAALKDKRLTVVIDDWPINSAYPLGHYVAVLGVIGDKDTEAAVILRENDVPHYDFSEAVYDCLPKGQWSVEPEEERRRLDLRGLCVSSVDPMGCRDIDDALHCRTLPNGNVEVGVHIADVSHFMPEGCPMDEEAAKRSTSVYLVDRRINMLPQLLTENLCSLVGNEDRYAFSIIWEFEPNSVTLVKEWFGKSIIRSQAALYYGDAQAMIDDAKDTSELAVSLRGLMQLSRILKADRDKAGALTLASQEFKFKVDNDHNSSTDMVLYKKYETNSMVEEWMLYANVAAAKRIYREFPKAAMLRRHQAPAEHAFEELNTALKAKSLPLLDGSSSKSLNMSLNNCADPNDPYFNHLVRMLTTRCLRQAQYFCSAAVPYEEFQHYGLAMGIYTHFTSPIRRYADVVVHRQLAAITGAMNFDAARNTVERLEAVAENINYRHEQAQRAGRDSQNLFTGFFLKSLEERGGTQQHEEGYLTKISETHVHVLVPKYGQEGRITVEDVPKHFSIAALKVFDKLRVAIEVVKEGDVCSAKLRYRLVDPSEEPQPAPEEPAAKKARDDE